MRASYILPKNYYKSANGFIIVYSIKHPDSFENIHFWMQEIEEQAMSNVIPVIIVATDYDESADVSGQLECKIRSQCRNQYGVNCKVINQITGYNVKSSLKQLIKAIIIQENQKETLTQSAPNPYKNDNPSILLFSSKPLD